MIQHAREYCAHAISRLAGLIGRDQSERVGEGEVGVGVRVQQHDPELVRPGRAPAPSGTRRSTNQSVPSTIPACRYRQTSPSCPRCGVSACARLLAHAAARAIHDMHTLALQRAHRGQDPQLAQCCSGWSADRAARDWRGRRCSGRDCRGSSAFARQAWDTRDTAVHEIGPLARAAGIAYIAGDQDHVERLAGMEQIQFGEQPPQAFVAARP